MFSFFLTLPVMILLKIKNWILLCFIDNFEFNDETENFHIQNNRILSSLELHTTQSEVCKRKNNDCPHGLKFSWQHIVTVQLLFRNVLISWNDSIAQKKAGVTEMKQFDTLPGFNPTGMTLSPISCETWHNQDIKAVTGKVCTCLWNSTEHNSLRLTANDKYMWSK